MVLRRAKDNCVMFKNPAPSTPQFQATEDGICYLNGHHGLLSQTSVSVLDRGFIFGDAIYEVIPVYGGRLFKFDQHMARLERSLGAVRMTNPHATMGWRSIFETLLKENARHFETPLPLLNASIYLQITRGVAPRDHVIPQHLEPTVFVMCQPRAPLSDELRQNGAFCITHEDFRWKKAHIKTTSLMGSVLARDLSAKEKALETIMFRDGFLSEAASSNVWVVKNGAVMGVPNDHLVLEGIRYGVLAQLCESQQIPFSLKPIRKEEVFAADELLLTSASKEVLAVTKLDALMIGDARPGPIYRRLYDAYQTLKHHD